MVWLEFWFYGEDNTLILCQLKSVANELGIEK